MSSLNNPHINTEEQEVDVKELFLTLLRYKKSIVVVVILVALISVALAYFAKNIYQSNLTLKIELPENKQSDFITAATGMQSENINNELIILKSRYIATKVLQKIKIGTRYYDESGYKSVELYKTSPFYVDVISMNPSLYGDKIYIYPIDQEHFRLELKKKESKFSSSKTIYMKRHKYDELIQSKFFELKVHKLAPIKASKYSFSYTPNNLMYAAVQSSLQVFPAQDQSSVLILQYRDTVAQRGEDILHIIGKVYIQESIRNKTRGAKTTLAFIDTQLAGLNKELENSAGKLEAFKSSHVMISIDSKASVALENLSKYNDAMQTLILQENTLSSLLSYIELDKNLTGIDLSVIGAGSTNIENLIQQLQAAHTKKASLLVGYTENHPSIIKLDLEIKSLKTSLIDTIKGSLYTIKLRKIDLNRLIQESSKALSSLPEEEKELATLNRKYKINQTIYEFLLQKRAETAIIESSNVAGVRIIDDALSNQKAISPNRFLIVAMGIIIGIILAIIQAFIRNIIANKIVNVSEITGKTNLPVYAVLPMFKNKKSLYEDALRILKTRIDLKDEKVKIITISASVPGEGRSTTIIEFAKIIGKSGKKVAVLNLDMRKERKKKKPDSEIGISTFLSSDISLDKIKTTLDENVTFIASGEGVANSYELLVSQKFQNLINRLSEEYDYILLESPPMGVVADALVLMHMSDLNLIVCKIGYSKKNFIDNLNRFVYEYELKNVGIIVNALELKQVRPWI